MDPCLGSVATCFVASKQLRRLTSSMWVNMAAAQHRGSVHASYPMAPGSKYGSDFFFCKEGFSLWPWYFSLFTA